VALRELCRKNHGFSLPRFDNCRLISTIFDTPIAGLVSANRFNRLLWRQERGFWQTSCLSSVKQKGNMFRISIADTPSRRTLLVEGTLTGAWVAELGATWRNASQDLGTRKLLIDLTNVTAISSEGEGVLFDLMKKGVNFSSSSVLTRHMLKRLVRKKQ
jgi:hypothetical protein